MQLADHNSWRVPLTIRVLASGNSIVGWMSWRIRAIVAVYSGIVGW